MCLYLLTAMGIVSIPYKMGWKSSNHKLIIICTSGAIGIGVQTNISAWNRNISIPSGTGWYACKNEFCLDFAILPCTVVDSPFRIIVIPIIIPWILYFLMCQILSLIRSKHNGNRCQHCGYLLQGLSNNLCPECGTEFDRELLKKLEIKKTDSC